MLLQYSALIVNFHFFPCGIRETRISGASNAFNQDSYDDETDQTNFLSLQKADWRFLRPSRICSNKFLEFTLTHGRAFPSAAVTSSRSCKWPVLPNLLTDSFVFLDFVSNYHPWLIISKRTNCSRCGCPHLLLSGREQPRKTMVAQLASKVLPSL